MKLVTPKGAAELKLSSTNPPLETAHLRPKAYLREKLPVTNTLAYFVTTPVTKRKKFFNICFRKKIQK